MSKTLIEGIERVIKRYNKDLLKKFITDVKEDKNLEKRELNTPLLFTYDINYMMLNLLIIYIKENIIDTTILNSLEKFC